MLVALAGVLTLPPRAAVAQNDEASPSDVLQSIVRITATVPTSARTARSLGTQRTGSAIAIDGNGLLLTIGYIILEASRVEVMTLAGKVAPARVIAYDHGTGFGLLRASEPLGLEPVPLGDSSAMSVRTRVVAASFGGLQAAQPGFVVSRREFAGFWEYLLDSALYTAPPHPYFAGAALLGPGGELVGVGSLMVGDAANDNSPLPGNLFVPINLLKPILGELLLEGKSSQSDRAWLGVYTDDTAGPVIVGSTAADGPASKAGLRTGDAIVGVADEPVASMASFYRRVWALGGPGTKVPLNVVRDGELQEIVVRSRDRYDWLQMD